jgi:hypothetical protein
MVNGLVSAYQDPGILPYRVQTTYPVCMEFH